MRKLLIALFSLSLVAGLAACGDDGDDGGSTTTTEAPAADDATDDAPDDATDDPTDDPTGDATDDGPADGDEEDYVAALAENLAGGSDDPERLTLSEDEASCLSQEWIDIVTVDALRAAGVEPAELADPDTNFTTTDLELDLEQGREMVAAAEDCDVDLVDQFRNLITEGMDPAEGACLDQELEDDVLAELVAQSLVTEVPTDDLQAEIERIDAACAPQ